MALFRYVALGEKKRKIVGIVSADSLALAKEQLFKEKVLVTRLEPIKQTLKERSLPPSVLLNFTKMLGQLTRAGLPLYESLLTVEEKYRMTPHHAIFLQMCEHVQTGVPFSECLESYPRTFSEVYICMIKAAELSGSLEATFDQLSSLITKEQKLKKQLFGALAYPAFLSGFCALVVLSLFFIVLPSMQELFEGRHLHFLTRSLLGISQFLNHHKAGFFGALTVSLIAIGTGVRTRPVREFLQKISIKIPFIKTLSLQISLIRFSRTCSILMANGVPLTDSLRLSKEVLNNFFLEDALGSVEQEVLEGKSFSQELKKIKWIPPLFVRMLSTAEKTGNMPDMLKNIAEIYEEELEMSLQQVMSLLQPILLLILGLIVGLVLLAVLIPLTDVGSFLEN